MKSDCMEDRDVVKYAHAKKTTRAWILCPHCKKRIAQYDPDALVRGLFVHCNRCKADFELKIPNQAGRT